MALYQTKPQQILPEWIDYNGHMNMGYYTVLFDLASDEVFAHLGMGPDYAKARGLTTYAAEFRVRYLRELHQGATVHTSFQLLAADAKRFHYCQHLYHQDGWLAATGEGLTLHIDQSGPKVAPFPPDILANVMAMTSAHADLPKPSFIGNEILVPSTQ